MPTLVAAIQERQGRRDALVAAIGAAEAVGQMKVDRQAIERKVLEHVETWRALLTTHVAVGRQLLREVLDRPLRFTPEGKQYRFAGDVTTGQLVAGLVGLPPCLGVRPSNRRDSHVLSCCAPTTSVAALGDGRVGVPVIEPEERIGLLFTRRGDTA